MAKAEELLANIRAEIVGDVMKELRSALDGIETRLKTGSVKKSKTIGRRSYRTGQKGILPKWVKKQEGVKAALELVKKYGVDHQILEKL